MNSHISRDTYPVINCLSAKEIESALTTLWNNKWLLSKLKSDSKNWYSLNFGRELAKCYAKLIIAIYEMTDYTNFDVLKTIFRKSFGHSFREAISQDSSKLAPGDLYQQLINPD